MGQKTKKKARATAAEMQKRKDAMSPTARLKYETKQAYNDWKAILTKRKAWTEAGRKKFLKLRVDLEKKRFAKLGIERQVKRAKAKLSEAPQPTFLDGVDRQNHESIKAAEKKIEKKPVSLITQRLANIADELQTLQKRIEALGGEAADLSEELVKSFRRGAA